MQGFISMHRKLMDNPIWSDPNYLKLWIYCLFKASHKEHEQLVGNQMVPLKRGQFVTGRNALTDDMNRGVKPKQRLDNLTWWRYLNNLQKWGMLNIKTTNKYSLVTIDKYEEYQDVFSKVEHETEHQMNNKRTSNEQQLNTNNNGNKGNNANNDLKSIYEHWNSKEIIVHRSLNQKAKSHINARLGDYSKDELLTAIDNYNTILTDDKYYWTHKWTLETFMNPNNVIRFLEDSDPFTTFLKGGQANEPDRRSFAGTKSKGRSYAEELERERPSFIRSV